MSMFNDLNTLSPEEKDKLLSELLSRYESDVATPETQQVEEVGANDGLGTYPHEDEAEDKEMLEPVLNVLEMLIQKVEELEDRLMKNESLVVDDLFGGIQKLYQGNLRTKGIGDLQSKYGHMFEPHMGAIKELEPEGDLYGSLYDMISQVRGSDDTFDDVRESEAIGGVAKSLAEKIAKIKGAVAPADGVAIEKTEVKAVPADGEVGADQAFLDSIKKMKEGNKARGAKSLF
jgi:hypothetical protein